MLYSLTELDQIAKVSEWLAATPGLLPQPGKVWPPTCGRTGMRTSLASLRALGLIRVLLLQISPSSKEEGNM